MNTTSTRLRQLADRMGLDGFAEELREIAVELEAPSEPFGYFRAEPFGWTDCAATDEGAIALYERPTAPAVPQGALEALRDALSVCSSVSVSRDRKVVREGCTLYAQTEEWCNWAENEVAPKIRAAIELASTPAAPSQEPAVLQGLEPAGFLLHWPAPGGSREIIWSDSRISGDAIGCPVTPVFKLSAQSQPVLTGCNCRWDGGTQVQWCELHLAHKDAIHEWAERAKTAEAKLAQLSTAQEPVTLTDEYAGVIAWIGDKQCKRVLTEGAIKHEHTPGVAMRNTAHTCAQEVIAALREKEQTK